MDQVIFFSKKGTQKFGFIMIKNFGKDIQHLEEPSLFFHLVRNLTVERSFSVLPKIFAFLNVKKEFRQGFLLPKHFLQLLRLTFKYQVVILFLSKKSLVNF